MFTELLFLVALIALNGFFAASEIAVISLNDNKIKQMAEKGNKKAVLLKSLLNEPSKFLATIQIGVTFAGFLASAFASESFANQLVGLIKQTNLSISESTLKNISIIIITLILSYFTLILGELVPKRLAMKKSEAISMFAVKPLIFLSIITSPIIKLLTISTNFVVKLFGLDPYSDEEQVTEEEIRMMVDLGEEKGVIEKTEKEMINNIFEFDNKTVEEIMTYRTGIVALPVDANEEEIRSLINQKKYTRIPVYQSNIDNIIGILHIKDLIPYLDKNINKETFNLQKIIRPAYYVPSSKRIDELFKEMKKNKIHMAIVIDEYGGTAGIITMEDLIEEIVGDIFDEYDEDKKDFEKLDETTYIVNGTISLDVIKEYFDVDLPIDEYETVSGFIIGQLGKIPEENEKPEIEFDGLVFKVEEINKKRIAKVKIYMRSLNNFEKHS
ncbi:hemolysin family protein [Thermoanaerobacter uzonensis]|uniref:hemolysin family protein n=1 Tax=Thermoanaerobacter uzonensis TaxID=447593 RepID=UPI003D7689A6